MKTKLELIKDPEVWAWVRANIRPVYAARIIQMVLETNDGVFNLGVSLKAFEDNNAEFYKWWLNSIRGGDPLENAAYRRVARLEPTLREMREGKVAIELFNAKWGIELDVTRYCSGATDKRMSRSSLLYLLEKLDIKRKES